MKSSRSIARSNAMALKKNFFFFNFACAHAGYLVIFTETGKYYYHGRKVRNYKCLHEENVLAVNASGLLCQRRGAIKMLIELDLNVR